MITPHRGPPRHEPLVRTSVWVAKPPIARIAERRLMTRVKRNAILAARTRAGEKRLPVVLEVCVISVTTSGEISTSRMPAVSTAPAASGNPCSSSGEPHLGPLDRARAPHPRRCAACAARPRSPTRRRRDAVGTHGAVHLADAAVGVGEEVDHELREHSVKGGVWPWQ